MSASLVGSEMCIRDRWSTRESSSPSALSAARGIRTAAGQAGPRRRLRVCLLYTSDAADDM
eukprot:8238260-Alexandrium_andersonii.AAC.1